MRNDGREGMNIREQAEKKKEEEKQEGTGISPTFDTSSPTHINTYTHTHKHKHIHALTHKGPRVSVSIGTTAHSMTMYISKDRDLNTRGPRRSP